MDLPTIEQHCFELLRLIARVLFDRLVTFQVAFSQMDENKVPCTLVELVEYRGQNKQIRTSFASLKLRCVKKLII